MTPRRIFLFGCCVIVVIFIISLIIPKEMKVGSFTFRYPDHRSWLRIGAAEYKDIQAIIVSVDTIDHLFETALPAGNDSIAKGNVQTALKPDSQRQASVDDDIFSGTYPFEFPKGQDTLLFPLFRSLHNISRLHRTIRILHYGDSQIEGDRITSTIRNYVQKNYGGRGIGFLPIIPANDFSVTFQQDVSPHWKRFSIFDKDKEVHVPFNRYGISGNLTRYIPAGEADSVAHIGLLPVYTGYRNMRTFTDVRLFYGQSENPFTATVNEVYSQQITATNTISSVWWQFESPQNSIDLLLSSVDLPDLYGITLDGDRGVAVDNLPQRGASGLEFSRMDTALMGEMFRMMNVEMLIFQFGANIVPHIVDNYDYFSRRWAQELRLLKTLKRGLIIVVTGVNDISQNSADGYQSYPNIVKIRDAQKKAAFETGCVFWDLYEAMGGENSMPGWVFAEPPLAQKDFVHFTVGGAKIVAELFCRAWEKEYRRFLKSQ